MNNEDIVVMGDTMAIIIDLLNISKVAAVVRGSCKIKKPSIDRNIIPHDMGKEN